MSESIETVSADEIRNQLQNKTNNTLTLDKPDNELQQENHQTEQEESNNTEEEKPQKKLPYKERLDQAYNNLQSDIEREAWAQGWKPQELFAGKNKDGSDRPFISAEEFLNKTKNALPIANDRLKELTKELEETKKLAKETQDRIKKAEEKGYQKALAELELKQQQAVELGDVDEFNKLKKEEKEIINNQFANPKDNQEEVVENVMDNNPPSPQQQTMLSPRDQQILQNWSARNTWMRTDPKLANYAIAAEKELLNTKPYLSLEDRLQVVEEEVKDIFYNKFNNSYSNNTPSYSSGTRNFGSLQNKDSYSSLPDSIKKQCDSLIKIRGITGEDNIKKFKQTFAKSITK